MSDAKPQELEFEIIPATLAVVSMMQKVFDWRNFFLQLSIENAARQDGIDLKQGWKLDAAKGVWIKPKEKSSATVSDEGVAQGTDRESD